MKIKDLTINEIINFCMERESCLGCPLKTFEPPKPDKCISTLYQAEKNKKRKYKILNR